MAQSKLRALDDERPEGLAELDARNVAGPVRKPDDRPHLFDFLEQRHVRLSGLGPAGEEDALRRALTGLGDEARQRCSARNGITGAIPRMPWTRACHSPSAASSPSQKRRRERRIYQLETSSTNASKLSISL